MSRKPSWSPNSTYLHLDFLCQHTKKKDKAGQFATGSPEHSNKNGEHQENHGKPPKPKAKATKIALLGFFADIQKFSCLCAWNLMVVIILQPDRQIETIFFSIVTILMPIDARNQFIGKMGPTFCSFSFLSLFTFHTTLSNFSFFHGFFIFWPLVS